MTNGTKNRCATITPWGIPRRMRRKFSKEKADTTQLVARSGSIGVHRPHDFEQVFNGSLELRDARVEVGDGILQVHIGHLKVA